MKRLKLNILETKKISSHEVNNIVGGAAKASCACSCYYRNSGGASSLDNAWANYENGLASPEGAYIYIITPDGIVHKVIEERDDALTP